MHWYRVEFLPGTKESLRYQLFYPVMTAETFSLSFIVRLENWYLRLSPVDADGLFSSRESLENTCHC